MRTRLLRRTSSAWRHLLPLRCWWAPRIVYIEPTNACNLRCTFCPQASSQQQRGFMNFDLFRKVVDETSKSSHIHLYYRGEPTLHPQIAEMSKYAKRDHKLTICTNGTQPLDEVVADRVVFNSTVSDEVVSDAVDRFNTVALELLGHNSEREQKILSIGAAVYLKKHLQWAAPCENTQRSVTPCLQPWMTLGVFHDGSVVPCCVDFEGALVVGSLHSESLHSVWNGTKMCNIRRQLRSGQYGCADYNTLLEPYEIMR